MAGVCGGATLAVGLALDAPLIHKGVADRTVLASVIRATVAVLVRAWQAAILGEVGPELAL